MGIKYEALLKHFRAEPDRAARELKEAFAAKQLKPTEFNLSRLFEECFGYGEYRHCKEERRTATKVFEAAGAVSTAAFQNISGQIVYSALLEGYEDEEFVFSKIIPEEQITNGTLDGEKIAGLTNIGDETGVRNEGDPYPLGGVGEDWIFAPAVKDRGLVVAVTWEAVFADRTGRLLEHCGKVGHARGIGREKQAIDCLIDENTAAHRYNWRGTVIASYGDNSGNHTWDNLAASNALVDWTDLDAAEQVLNGIVDPYTGEPVVISPTHLITTKQLEATALRVLNATEIRVATPGYATSANPTQTNQQNPYKAKYTHLTSRLLAARMATDTRWFLGNPAKAMRYRVAEKMQVVQAPPNNSDEFHRRIVQQYRVNERGAYYWVDPRQMVANDA